MKEGREGSKGGQQPRRKCAASVSRFFEHFSCLNDQSINFRGAIIIPKTLDYQSINFRGAIKKPAGCLFTQSNASFFKLPHAGARQPMITQQLFKVGGTGVGRGIACLPLSALDTKQKRQPSALFSLVVHARLQLNAKIDPLISWQCLELRTPPLTVCMGLVSTAARTELPDHTPRKAQQSSTSFLSHFRPSDGNATDEKALRSLVVHAEWSDGKHEICFALTASWEHAYLVCA